MCPIVFSQKGPLIFYHNYFVLLPRTVYLVYREYGKVGTNSFKNLLAFYRKNALHVNFYFELCGFRLKLWINRVSNAIDMAQFMDLLNRMPCILFYFCSCHEIPQKLYVTYSMCKLSFFLEIIKLSILFILGIVRTWTLDCLA